MNRNVGMADSTLDLTVLTETPGWLARLPDVVDLSPLGRQRRLRRRRPPMVHPGRIGRSLSPLVRR